MNLIDAYHRVQKNKNAVYYDKNPDLYVKWKRQPGIAGRVILEGESGIDNLSGLPIAAIKNIGLNAKLDFEEYGTHNVDKTNCGVLSCSGRG